MTAKFKENQKALELLYKNLNSKVMKSIPIQYHVDDDTIQKIMRIQWLKGILTYTVWADAMPNGDAISDNYEAELEALIKELS